MYYLAYGSNLSVEQMLQRCPQAVYIGTCDLEGYQLVFRGSRTGSYLSVDKCPGGHVPCVVWRISEADEQALDRYEGYPHFYGRFTLQVDVNALNGVCIEQDVPALIYALPATAPLGAPRAAYYNTCLEGYRRFGFAPRILAAALRRSTDAAVAEQVLKLARRQRTQGERLW